MRPKPISLLVLTIGLSLVITGSCYAEIYKTTDKKGKVSFSDKPQPQADVVKIRPPNTMDAAPTDKDVVAPQPEEGSEPTIYSDVSISHPKDGAIIANGLIPFSVSASVSPALQEGHSLRLSIDGKTHSSGTGNFTISSINRGKHSLQVTVVDSNENILLRSAIIHVFAYRPS